VDIPHFMKKLIKGSDMKKKLLVLLIAITPALIPSLAFANCTPWGGDSNATGLACCPGLKADGQGFCY
jgi:hypothetical protein